MKRSLPVAEYGKDVVAARRDRDELQTKMAPLICTSGDGRRDLRDVSVSARDQSVTKLDDDVFEGVAIAIDVRDRQYTRRSHETDRRQELVGIELCAVDIDDDGQLTNDGIREAARRDDLRFDVVFGQCFLPLAYDVLALRQQCHAWRHHASE
jgi:hypothetical protein